jgi:hypothetical protein
LAGVLLEIDGMHHFQDPEMKVYRGHSILKQRYNKIANLNVFHINHIDQMQIQKTRFLQNRVSMFVQMLQEYKETL